MINDRKLIIIIQNDHINFLHKQKLVKSLKGSIEEKFITYIKRVLNTAQVHMWK